MQGPPRASRRVNNRRQKNVYAQGNSTCLLKQCSSKFGNFDYDLACGICSSPSHSDESYGSESSY
jgi:hypothetical protein